MEGFYNTVKKHLLLLLLVRSLAPRSSVSKGNEAASNNLYDNQWNQKLLYPLSLSDSLQGG